MRRTFGSSFFFCGILERKRHTHTHTALSQTSTIPWCVFRRRNRMRLERSLHMSASDTHTHTHIALSQTSTIPWCVFHRCNRMRRTFDSSFCFLFFERTRAGSAALHHTRQCVHAKAHTQHVFAQGTTSAIAAQCQPLLLSLVHDATCIMISQFRVPRECRYASRGTVYSNRQQLDRSTSSAYLVLY